MSEERHVQSGNRKAICINGSTIRQPQVMSPTLPVLSLAKGQRASVYWYWHQYPFCHCYVRTTLSRSWSIYLYLSVSCSDSSLLCLCLFIPLLCDWDMIWTSHLCPHLHPKPSFSTKIKPWTITLQNWEPTKISTLCNNVCNPHKDRHTRATREHTHKLTAFVAELPL